MVAARDAVLPGLYLAAAHDPVAGIKADFGVGRAEPAAAVAVFVVQAGHIVVEQGCETAGAVAGNVLRRNAQRLRGHYQ